MYQIDLFLNKKNSKTILCLGDIILDSFAYGSVKRISPEAPIPVMNLESEKVMLGGSGNVIRNINALNADVECIIPSCESKIFKTVYEKLNELNNVSVISIETKSYKIPYKRRFISQNQQILRLDDEVSNQKISNEFENKVKEEIESRINEYSLIILSDYAKGFLTDSLCKWIVSIANERNIPVIVDPKGSNYEKYSGATCITPNKSEFDDICKKNVTSNDEIILEARNIINDYKIKSIMVTLGAHGSIYVDKDIYKHIKSIARDVYDVSGAGDSVVAALSVALNRGLSGENAASIANVSGGLAVEKMGTAIVSSDEIYSEISKMSGMSYYNEKIKSIEDLAFLREKWRKSGFKVGFTNGCFDLLHLGHIHSIKEAKKHCDKLIVAINSDSSVKKLKGDERPIQEEEVRMNVMAHMDLVDGVILFGDETPYNIINEIKPDFLFKGKDYVNKKVVGSDILKSYGGEIILLPIYEGQSTTNTVNKLKVA